MADDEPLPTIGQAISQWLGVQLPSIALPQTLKNLDKAIGKLVLAGGENLETRIRSNTGKAKAKGKLDLEGMYRTEEERRKLENKAATTQAAIEEMETDPGTQDAQREIEDDWLNLFARLSEDKSSEELRRLFGKVLAGEVKRPGSFSLRTIQILATLSKTDADLISKFLGYAVDVTIVPFNDVIKAEISDGLRLVAEELGIAGHPSQIGGMALNYEIAPHNTHLSRISHAGILVENHTDESVKFKISGQVLTSSARELAPIANSPPPKIEFVKAVAKAVYDQLRGAGKSPQIDSGLIKVHVVFVSAIAGDQVQFQIIETLKGP